MESISREHFESILKGRPFTEDEAYELADKIIDGLLPNSQLAAILTVLRTRLPNADEIRGFKCALLARTPKIPVLKTPVLDLCGTGGDGKSTFNISTTTAFVCAALGVTVAKHGNYSFTSKCGSSNLIEGLKVNFAKDPEQAKLSLERFNLAFLHAPDWHTSLKNIAPIRKELGFPTIFNLLGPIANPINPELRVVGVYSPAIQSLYRDVLLKESSEFAIVHSLDGYDEISLTGAARIIYRGREQHLNSESFGAKSVSPQAIQGGTSLEENVSIVQAILDGHGSTEQTDVVSSNAAIALLLAQEKLDLKSGFKLAKECILSGEPGKLLRKMQDFKL
mgnify:CR=1 FL=1